MSLKQGNKAPDFTLLDENSKEFNLYRNMNGRACILYFYPKDFTPGCTAEACSFRDHFNTFRGLNIDVIGISTDDPATHMRFKKQYDLPFTLLSDTDGEVSKLYGAKLPFLNVSSRISYMIDKNHKIASVYKNFFDGEAHIRAMRAKLEQLK
ncbi:MAG: peroxiredoxin [Cyclobacteriaceae bacterium]|nr:peroxiredoxin [Cyclobacteriaceae bacterium]